jgi:hypothetical protein
MVPSTDLRRTPGARRLAAWLVVGLALVAAAVGVRACERSESADPPQGFARRGERPPSTPSLATPKEPGDAAPTPSTTVGPKGPPEPRPSPRTGDAGRDPERSAHVLVRMEVVRPDGGAEPVEVSGVTVGGRGWVEEALRIAGWRVQVRAGSEVVFHTEDPRAAVARISVRVPDPPPDVLVARVPSADDPRLASVVLEVVDAKTGEPLPDAVLEWDPSVPGPSRQEADERGRIAIAIPGSGAPGIAALDAFDQGWASLRAPAHRGAGGFAVGRFDPRVGSTRPNAVSASELASALEREVWRKPLEPLPPDRVERQVRLVGPTGAPVVDAHVALVDAVDPKPLVQLGSAVTPSDLWMAARRTGPDGRVPVSTWKTGGVGLEMRIGGVPFAAWGLSDAEWPAEGPRDLRVPERADVELVLEDLGDGRAVTWDLDPLGLGSATTPLDLLAAEVRVVDPVLDARAAKAVAAKEWFFLVGVESVEGVASGDPPTVRLPVAVGGRLRVHVSDGSERRVFEAAPTAPGTLRIVRRFRDLPLAPPPR